MVMPFTELLPNLQKLAYFDKIRAIQFLATELSKTENFTADEHLEGLAEAGLDFGKVADLEVWLTSKRFPTVGVEHLRHNFSTHHRNINTQMLNPLYFVVNCR
jgi:hypothetical protein